jgi:2-methylisocitrate lyase-like PEP mutase family enzyme
MRELAVHADELRRRHFGDAPLVLLNAWDAASARAVTEAGHPVIATSSAAVAASLGLGDHEQMRAEEAFGAIGRICASVDVPVTADIEAGYGLSPGELARRLLDAGAVGCNLEDSDHRAGRVLLEAEPHSERISELCDAARSEGVPLVVNARVDVYLRTSGSLREQHKEAIRRARLYLDAGATCVYPIGLTDPEEIGLFVRELAAPVNVWLRAGGPSLGALGALGVARVSVAGALQHAAMRLVGMIATDILAGVSTSLFEGPGARG